MDGERHLQRARGEDRGVRRARRGVRVRGGGGGERDGGGGQGGEGGNGGRGGQGVGRGGGVEQDGGRGRGGGRGRRNVITDEIRRTVIDHVLNHGLTMREAGLRVQPNLSRYTIASIVRTFRNELR